MTGSNAPRGLIVDLVTPLKKTRDIDSEALDRLLDRVLPYSHAVLLASPQIGEGYRLNAEQLKELLDNSLSKIMGNIPVLFWISRNTEDKTKQTLLDLVDVVEKRNYKGPVFWVDTPLSYRSNRGLPDYYRELCAETKGPFILYNDPDFVSQRKPPNQPLKRANIRTRILKEMALIDEIKGIIFRGSLDRAHNYQRAVRAGANFRIYDGDETHFLKHPSLSGVTSSGACLAPKAWQRITTSSMNLEESSYRYPDQLRQIWEAGDYVRKLQDIYRLNPVPIIKAALSRLGVIGQSVSYQELQGPLPEVDKLVELVRARDDERQNARPPR